MKIKTSELTGAQLDCAVAKCEGYTLTSDGISQLVERGTELRILGPNSSVLHYSPSTDWAQGGPIIEREEFTVSHSPYDHVFYGRARPWCAEKRGVMEYGETLLIAAMRCYVASKMGDEVEVPGELA